MVEQSTSQNRGLLIKSELAPSTAPKTGYGQLRRLEGPRHNPTRPSIAHNKS